MAEQYSLVPLDIAEQYKFCSTWHGGTVQVWFHLTWRNITTLVPLDMTENYNFGFAWHDGTVQAWFRLKVWSKYILGLYALLRTSASREGRGDRKYIQEKGTSSCIISQGRQLTLGSYQIIYLTENMFNWMQGPEFLLQSLIFECNTFSCILMLQYLKLWLFGFEIYQNTVFN